MLENAGFAVYSPTGHIVFARGESLMAAPFDLDKLVVSGEVTSLTGGLRTYSFGYNGPFQVSSEGSLVYVPGGRLGTDRLLAIVDAAGKVTPFTSDRRAFVGHAIPSRDGRKAAVILLNVNGVGETWIAELDRPGLRRVVAFPNANAVDPRWSPDGLRLAYMRVAQDKDDGVYIQQADGSGMPQAVLKMESQQVIFYPLSWAPDRSGLLVEKEGNGKFDFLFVPFAADGKAGTPRDLRVTPYNKGGGYFSPDGRMVVFASDESGRTELYVANYGADGMLGLPARVSRGLFLGRWSWASDSRRIFYNSDANTLVSVTVELKPALSASAPIVAYNLKKLRVDSNAWDILPDGRLLAIQRGEGEDDVTELNIVLNWFTELRERMSKGVDARGTH